MAAVGACTLIDAVSIDAVTAIRLSHFVQNLPREKRLGAVHSVYERVVNLLDPQGNLLALASAVLDDAPRTIRIATADWNKFSPDVGEPVVFEADALGVGIERSTRIVMIQKAQRWEPRTVSLGKTSPETLDAIVTVIDLVLKVPAERSRFEEASAALLSQGIKKLEAAIMGGAGEDQTTSAVRQLLGLGAGLTPAGDDVLTGLVLVAAQPGTDLAFAKPVIARALRDAADRTTALSAATLEEAVLGRSRQRLHDLLNLFALADRSLSGDPGAEPDSEAYRARLEAALIRVRDIGHSSGFDLLAGIRLGLRLEVQLRQRSSTSVSAAHDFRGHKTPDESQSGS
ncbi:DUF2877 domain-containing protein [Lysinibacter sp. HNR]|uniref:DUF2877 domain-containing protein n=1 Tax=Lysinibacter sp. HNR TaxID=3031408 RepID=UPI0024351201|nr:DUF2877 domain-containing protein [Lysinibacter sp. HNR]WGD38093.1 DUF2877 domain-containing protein [Lysinibacter sp. HNR]